MVSMVECSPPAGLPATEVAPPPNFEVAPSWRCPVKIQLPYSDLLIQALPHLSEHLKESLEGGTEVAPPPKYQLTPAWWRCPGKTQLSYSGPDFGTFDKCFQSPNTTHKCFNQCP